MNRRRRRSVYLVALGLALGAFVALSGVRSWSDQWRGMRSDNRNEEFYRYIAQELAEPALCKRISWSAMVVGGFFIAPSYTRSACYDFIAGRGRPMSSG